VGGQTYITSVYDGSQGNGIYWYDSSGYTPQNPPILLPGQGFFLFTQGSCTNTFAGSVAVASGATNNLSIPTAYNFYMVGSTIPYSGYVTNVVNGTSQGINLNGLPSGSQVLTWDEPSGSYVTYVYDQSQGNGIFWYDSSGYVPGPCPSVTVGQGFFIFPQDVYTWIQSLP
jgi:hypothetical protein